MDAISGDDPFIMMADGRGWLFSPSGLLDGPLPTHYEPFESPVRNPLYPDVGANPAAITLEAPREPAATRGDPRYPIVATTFRLTEHHTAGGMSRNLPWLAELQPEMFAEIDPVLARRARDRGRRLDDDRDRARARSRRARTSPTRMRPLRVDGRIVHQVALPWHWGYAGAGARATPPTTWSRFRRPERVDPGARRSRATCAPGGARADDGAAGGRRAGAAHGAATDDHAGRAARAGRRASMAARPSSAIHAAATPGGWASSPTRRCASAARRARSPASSGTTCPPTARSSAGAAPTTTPASWRVDLAPRALRRELPEPWRPQRRRAPTAGAAPDACGARRRRPAARRARALDAVHVRRLQALHERRLPGRLPDRGADPHRVRDRDRPARRLQRLRLLHPGVPVRRDRPRPLRRPRRQVHAVLRPPGGRAGAGLREGVPDRLDPVRRRTRSSSSAPQRRVATLHERGLEGAYLYGAGDEPGEQLAGGLGAFFLLTEPPERFGLPGAGRVADPGERRRRAAAARRRGGGDGVRALAAHRGRRRWRSWPAARGGPPVQTAARRDMHPGAWARRGEPGPGARAVEGAPVALRGARFGDARWSFLYGEDTRYAAGRAERGERGRGRRGACAAATESRRRAGAGHQARRCGPGRCRSTSGSAAWPPGSSFVALACDLAGDDAVGRGRAATSRSAPLVALRRRCSILDLGRPERFLNMLRIFKPRSPMYMGAWCLARFSARRRRGGGRSARARARRPRRWRGERAASAATSAPTRACCWPPRRCRCGPQPRLFLGPIFVCTAAATGAAANRLALAATGVAAGHPTRARARPLETVAMATELALSAINERRLGPPERGARAGTPRPAARARQAGRLGWPAPSPGPQARRSVDRPPRQHRLPRRRSRLPLRVGRRRPELRRRRRGGRAGG